MVKIKEKTKLRTIYKMLEARKGQFVSVWDLMKESNCVCVGSMCATLRKRGCVVVNKMIPAVNSFGQHVMHSSYQLVSGVLSDVDFGNEENFPL